MKVACIDDHPANNRVIECGLSDEYLVHTFGSAEDFLSSFLDPDEFDVLLLDVNLPGLNGFELCQQLRTENFDQPIIIVSALASIDDRLKGYHAGCDDYICKPFDLIELREKVRISSNLWRFRQQTELSLKDASQAVHVALQQASELGLLVTFCRNLTTVESYPELAELVQELLAQFGLQGLARFNQSIFSSGHVASALETELLLLGCNAPRVLEYGKRAIYNSSRASLLIRNHPHNDQALAGRLKDHMAILIEALDSKVELMELKNSFAVQKQQQVEQAVSIMHEAVSNIHDKTQVMDLRLKHTIDLGKSRIRDILLSMDLSEYEQSQIDAVLDDFFEEFTELENLSIDVADSVEQVINAFQASR